jgi:hypothetical protein
MMPIGFSGARRGACPNAAGALAVAIALLASMPSADAGMREEGPSTLPVDISAVAGRAGARACRLTGGVIFWVARTSAIVDHAWRKVQPVVAGLAQFQGESRLEECTPGGAPVDVSGAFANFLVHERGAAPDRQGTAALASDLLDGDDRLADAAGASIPLVDGITVTAAGSPSYRFRIVLIVDSMHSTSPSVDAVILRESIGSPRARDVSQDERRASRCKWSSVQSSATHFQEFTHEHSTQGKAGLRGRNGAARIDGVRGCGRA